MATLKNHVAPILAGEPTLNDDQRADLYDLFHAANSTTELAGHLAQLNMHPMLKADLLRAKNRSMEPDNLDRAVQIIHRLASLDPETLRIAESHPRVLEHYMDALKEEAK